MLQTPEAGDTTHPFEVQIEEIRTICRVHACPTGSWENLIELPLRLSQDASFRSDFVEIIHSLQGRGLHLQDVLDIVVIAIGGTSANRHSRELSEYLNLLGSFLSSIGNWPGADTEPILAPGEIPANLHKFSRPPDPRPQPQSQQQSQPQIQQQPQNQPQSQSQAPPPQAAAPRATAPEAANPPARTTSTASRQPEPQPQPIRRYEAFRPDPPDVQPEPPLQQAGTSARPAAFRSTLAPAPPPQPQSPRQSTVPVRPAAPSPLPPPPAEPAADLASLPVADITRALARLERGNFELRAHLDSIDQRISRMEPLLESGPASEQTAELHEPPAIIEPSHPASAPRVLTPRERFRSETQYADPLHADPLNTESGARGRGRHPASATPWPTPSVRNSSDRSHHDSLGHEPVRQESLSPEPIRREPARPAPAVDPRRPEPIRQTSVRPDDVQQQSGRTQSIRESFRQERLHPEGSHEEHPGPESIRQGRTQRDKRELDRPEHLRPEHVRQEHVRQDHIRHESEQQESTRQQTARPGQAWPEPILPEPIRSEADWSQDRDPGGRTSEPLPAAAPRFSRFSRNPDPDSGPVEVDNRFDRTEAPERLSRPGISVPASAPGRSDPSQRAERLPRSEALRREASRPEPLPQEQPSQPGMLRPGALPRGFFGTAPQAEDEREDLRADTQPQPRAAFTPDRETNLAYDPTDLPDTYDTPPRGRRFGLIVTVLILLALLGAAAYLYSRSVSKDDAAAGNGISPVPAPRADATANTPASRQGPLTANPSHPSTSKGAAAQPHAAAADGKVLGARNAFQPSQSTEDLGSADGFRPAGTFVPSSVMDGRLVSAPMPDQPRVPANSGPKGIVVMEVNISNTGEVEDIHVLGGSPNLRFAAIDAVRDWRYKPYVLNGKPVEVRTLVRVDFTEHRSQPAQRSAPFPS